VLQTESAVSIQQADLLRFGELRMGAYQGRWDERFALKAGFSWGEKAAN
jgi:hypothetical protein